MDIRNSYLMHKFSSLTRKASIVKEAILKTLRLTLTFRQKWERGLATFRCECTHPDTVSDLPLSLPSSLSLPLSLPLSLSLASRAEGETIESEFSKCSHFLVTCLNNTVRRGSFPYCELYHTDCL